MQASPVFSMKARKVKIGNSIIYDVSKIRSTKVYQSKCAWILNVEMPEICHEESFSNEVHALTKQSEIDAIIEAYRLNVDRFGRFTLTIGLGVCYTISSAFWKSPIFDAQRCAV